VFERGAVENLRQPPWLLEDATCMRGSRLVRVEGSEGSKELTGCRGCPSLALSRASACSLVRSRRSCSSDARSEALFHLGFDR